MTNLEKPLKHALRAGAVLAVGALSLGSTGANGGALVARTSTLTPTQLGQAPVTPVIQEAVLETPGAPVVPTVNKVVRVSWGDGSDDFWGRLRNCESHGNYSTNTGNGYYGAYQYNDSTWNGYGGYQHASDAPASTQDQKAKSDYARRGASPWPTCGRR